MTPEQKSELLMAILAMDSYNQGYDAGVVHGAADIGTATLTTDSTSELGENATKATGFYAAAYTLEDGTTVISYRGVTVTVHSKELR